MAKERLLVIGDIHGRLDKLEQLLAQVKPTQDDELIFLGDYIDRGPDSWGVVKKVKELQEKFPRTVCLMGNHELTFVRSFIGSPGVSELLSMCEFDVEGWQRKALYSLQRGAEEAPHEVDAALRWLAALPLHHESRGVHFAHAGYNPTKPWEEQEPDDFVWCREIFFRRYRGEDTWVIGHTPVQSMEETVGAEDAAVPLFLPNNVIMLDTGAFMENGRPTCCDLLQGEIYQA